MNNNVYRTEFRDFTDIGGEGSYAVTVYASNAEAATKIVLSRYPSAWDVIATIIERR